MIKFEYNNSNGQKTNFKDICYDLNLKSKNFVKITNDPLLTSTFNVKYESTRYEGKNNWLDKDDFQ